jgi:hypothetical protein
LWLFRSATTRSSGRMPWRAAKRWQSPRSPAW